MLLNTRKGLAIKCDGSGYKVEVVLRAQTVAEAFQEAIARGWEIDPKTTDGYDHLCYCPKCKEEHERERNQPAGELSG